MATCLKYGVILAVFAIAGLHCGSSDAQALDTSAIEQQQGAIQDQITQGITNGTLSADQIATLQSRLQALGNNSGSGGATSAAETARNAGLGTIGTPGGETLRPLNNLEQGTTASTTNQSANTKSQTGPDPFTYNTLGPDAYQAQKYTNPGYNVPAYPTTSPQSLDTQQQYTQPSAGAPYGAGYGQAPGVGGTASQVYVYHPSMSR
jgi:hypothetical protein